MRDSLSREPKINIVEISLFIFLVFINIVSRIYKYIINIIRIKFSIFPSSLIVTKIA